MDSLPGVYRWTSRDKLATKLPWVEGARGCPREIRTYYIFISRPSVHYCRTRTDGVMPVLVSRSCENWIWPWCTNVGPAVSLSHSPVISSPRLSSEEPLPERSCSPPLSIYQIRSFAGSTRKRDSANRIREHRLRKLDAREAYSAGLVFRLDLSRSGELLDGETRGDFYGFV